MTAAAYRVPRLSPARASSRPGVSTHVAAATRIVTPSVMAVDWTTESIVIRPVPVVGVGTGWPGCP